MGRPAALAEVFHEDLDADGDEDDAAAWRASAASSSSPSASRSSWNTSASAAGLPISKHLSAKLRLVTLLAVIAVLGVHDYNMTNRSVPRPYAWLTGGR